APVASYDKMKEQMKNMTPEQKQAGMGRWKQWMDAHKADIVDQGAPVGPSKHVTKSGVSDTRNEIGGYMIVQAENAEKAAEIFKDAPHGDIENAAVDVMEMMPM
ncbi:hypothetical protein HY417_04365, partial [Candidatus Kaiserbacteria bacterium]|nr:hypothetical protein [Candidatus Kaiserbacteria bacterium]